MKKLTQRLFCLQAKGLMIIFILGNTFGACKNSVNAPVQRESVNNSSDAVSVAIAGQRNLAEGKPYTSSVASSGTYPDNSNLELTDGTVATGDFTSGAWQGRAVASYTHVIDLGVNSIVGEVACRFLLNTTSGINFPTTVTFASSINNTTYTNMPSTTITNVTSTIRRYKSSPSTGLSARFIRITVTGSGWLFEDNFEILGTSPAKILSGTFIQPSSTNLVWGQSNFATVYNYLRNVKMDHLVWQNTANTQPDAQNKKRIFFPMTAPLTSTEWVQENAGADPIGASLAQARLYGQKVWLGLNDNSLYWNTLANDPVWLNREFGYSNNIAQALWNRYGATYSDVIAGFYITFEIYNKDFNAQAQLNMQAALRSTVDYIHTNLGRPVMIAPFFITKASEAPFQTAAEYATSWVNYAKAPNTADIDIIALQDGVGAGWNTNSSMVPYFSAMKNAFTSNGVTSQLWVDIETFTPTFGTAPMVDVITKIKALQPYVTRATSFAFPHYDDPASHPTEYNEYKLYVEKLDASR